MYYEQTQAFYSFTDEEEDKIRNFLKERGYTKFGHNTACGDCCGMYSDVIWVNGVGGKFADEDKKALAEYMKQEKIEGSINTYHVDSDPRTEDWQDNEYQIII